MKNSEQPINPIANMHGYPTDLKNISVNDAVGLTKREYFAGLAMQGYMANRYTPHQDASPIAKYSIECADELLKQLEQ